MTPEQNKKRVMLDAGHYGDFNSSPVVKGYYESRRMWILHEYLAEALVGYGFTVGHTRSDEEKDLPVVERGWCASGYDLFLSLHSNACDDSGVDRVEVYRAFDDRCGSSVLAGRLADAVKTAMSVPKASVKTRKSTLGDWEYYGVLRGARAVGCPLYYIVEHSFHTNPYAANWLMSDENLFRLATAEAAAIADYYGVEPPEPFFPAGDVDGDGRVTARDAAMVKRIVLGSYTPGESELARADVDGNGKVNAKDYAMVKRTVTGAARP